MKTTVEITDDLLKRAKQVAVTEGISLRALIESGLRRELGWRRSEPYTMSDASFGGNGLQPGLAEGDWNQIRELAYEGRGG